MNYQTFEAKPLLQPVVIVQKERKNWLLYALLTVIVFFTVKNLFAVHFENSAIVVAEVPSIGKIEFDHLLSPMDLISVENVGAVPVEFKVVVGTEVNVNYEIFSFNPKASGLVKIYVDSQKSNLTIKVESPKSGIDYNDQTKVKVLVTLLEDCEAALDAQINAGELEWLANSKVPTVHVNTNLGSVKAKKFESNEIDIQIKMGNLKLDSASAQSIKLSVETGNLLGGLNSFSTLATDVKVGDINVCLAPSDNAKIKLNGKTGSIQSQIKGFKGSFITNVNLGNCKVSGNLVKITDSNQKFLGCRKEGTVGTGNGSINATIDLGTVKFQFD